jgi:recombinational DNA repair ATPase RecF
MRLKSLRLQSYRTHQDSTLNIGDATFVVVRGPNGGGKTSFADGLSMNVTSTTVSLPSDGKGFLDKLY